MASDTEPLADIQRSGAEGELARLGPYRVLEALGKGGMGQVYRAEDVRLKRQVALKVMNRRFSAMPNSRKRFLEEARAVAAVHHDNVVTIFDVGETSGTLFMAMELLSGATLDSTLASGDPQRAEWILNLAGQLAAGLSAAHRRGIIHRDIKPGNIWIQHPSGRAKVLDFGLALASGPIDSLADRGSVVGTPAYLSPEQARGEPLDDRSDLFSLGVVLYQLACGRLPLSAMTVSEQLIKLLAHPAERPDVIEPSVPAPLADLIMRLLAKEPRDRFRSAEAFAQAIRQTQWEIIEQAEAATRIVVATPSVAKSGSATSGTGKAAPFGKASWTKSKPLLAGLAVAALLAFGVLSWSLREEPSVAPATTMAPQRPAETVVLAKSLDVLRLSDIPAATGQVTAGEQARFKLTLANRASSAESDPRTVNRGARVIAQIATTLRPRNAARESQHLTPGFPKKLSAALIPAPGQTTVIDVDFLSTTLPPGEFDVIFDLQSPSGTSVSSVTTILTIRENLATADLLGFEKIRTEKGQGADTFVQLGSDQGFGDRPYVEIDKPSKAERPLKHAYLRFDLGPWADRRSKIDRALLLLTLEPGGLKGKATLAAYGVTQQVPRDWVEKGDGQIVWDASPSTGDIESYPFLGRVEFNNSGGSLENRGDELRLFGPGLDDYLRTGAGSHVSILLVRTTGGDKPTRLISREGKAASSPAIALRATNPSGARE